MGDGPIPAGREVAPGQVAEIIIVRDGELGRRGSGYRVGTTAVLTAAHVVEGTVSIRVRFDADLPGEWATEVVSCWADPRSDLAVLTIAPREGEPPVAVPRFGQISDRAAALAAQSVGFPLFKLRNDDGVEDHPRRYRDSHQADGSVAVLSNRREGALEVTVPPPERDPDPAVSPWEGMSGAAVWVGDRIIGVIAKHHRSDGLGRLAATRLDLTLESLDPGRQAELRTLLGLPDVLPDVVPPSAGEWVSTAYQAQVRDIAPDQLLDRDEELGSLIEDDKQVRHVFVSYVREDASSVDRLAHALRDCGVEVWVDRNQIKPGVRWAEAIRAGIRDGSFYLACFSTAYASRKCSYMNEELILAIEELRRRRFDQAWFIPVLLDDGEIPDIPIGRGETLRSLQWVDLREDWEAGICAILNMVSLDTETIRSAPVDADQARINSTMINDVDIPSPVATTPSEYVEKLEKLMHATGHSLRSLEACAYVHGDNLPRPTTKDALVKAGNWNRLPARPTVQVFVRACLCHKKDLPRALNENPLPPRDLCMCGHQDVSAWMTCYDKIASHRGAIDEWITSLWGRYRSQAANIFRITTLGSGSNYMVHNLGLTHKCVLLIVYGDRKSAAKALAELLQRDRHDAAAAISGPGRIETRAPKVISQLATDDPRASRQLFYAVAEFSPEKAVQLFERASIPIPQSDPPCPYNLRRGEGD